MTPSRRHLLGACALALACLLQGCGGASEGASIASAKSFLDKHEPKAALIELKSALQKNPQSPEARFLLGKTLLEQGDPVAAVVELGKARELKYAEQSVVPLLADAMLQSGEARKVVDQFGPTELADPAAAAALKTTVATAQAALNDRPGAEISLKAALRALPDHAPALLLQARLRAASNEIEAALALLDQVLAKDSGNERALVMKGDLLRFAKQDSQAALDLYTRAAAAHPTSAPAHFALVSMLIETGDIEGAKARFAAMKKAVPNRPETRLVDAQFAFLAQDYKTAREICEQLLKVAPRNLRVLQLAGAVEYRLNSFIQAEALLGRALKAAPDLDSARRLLAQTYLRLGEPGKAVDILQPLVERPAPDTEALALATEAHLQAGDIGRAEALSTTAAAARSGDARLRTAAALTQLAKGNDSRAIAELESVAAVDKGLRADLALIVALVRERDYPKALKAIDALERKQPAQPIAAMLQGRVHVLQGDAKAARASFERALKLRPNYFPAVASLAAIDLAEKHPEVARKRFDDLAAADPKNVRARLAIAGLLQQTGADREQVIAALNAAIAANGSEPAPRLRLVELYLVNGDAQAALVAAQNAAATLPDNADVLFALARSQAAAGNNQQALSSLNRLATMEPHNPRALLAQADVQVRLKDNDAAARSLRKALDIQPRLLAAQRGLIAVALADKRPRDAVALAKQVQGQRKDEPIGWQLEGDVEANGKSWPAAIAAYQTALQKGKNSESAIRLHQALSASEQRAEAERFAAGWLRERPRDAAFLFYLGDAALATKDYARAQEHYMKVAEIQPANALALNNVAWLKLQRGEAGALALAEQANKLMPNQPSLMDTLASVLVAENQIPKALELQRKAVALQPDDGALRLGLARTLLKAGERAEAKTELERLSKLGGSFPRQAEVAELLKSV